MNNETNELIESARDYLSKFKDGVLTTSSLFQEYEVNKASTMLCDIIDGMQWLMNVGVHLNLLEETEVVQINEKLKEIIEALENQDYILVGDLLQYELLPKAEELEEKINKGTLLQ